MNLYPLLLTPVYKEYLWGGQRIGRHFRRDGLPPVCAESWEVAARPEGTSVVRNGALRGQALGDLRQRYGKALLGERDCGGHFPLLVKILDARERLSVQVHPNAASAARYGGEAKTEMWYTLGAAPDARVYAGLRSGTTPDVLRAALADHTVADLIHDVPVSAGDVIFMPGGGVHAIGEGCLILEVQQNSDTTYRLYDWERVDRHGHPRELHIEQAMRAIDWDGMPQPKVLPDLLDQTPAGTLERLAVCPFFAMHRLRLRTCMPVPRPAGTGVILFVAEGSAHVKAAGAAVPLEAGVTCLLPAACEVAAIEATTVPTVVLTITAGDGTAVGTAHPKWSS